MRILVAAILWGVCSLALACDRGAALVVLDNLRSMASVSEQGGIVRYEWGPSMDSQSPDRRLRLVRAAADADACVTGRAREMRHFLNGRFFAVASPTSGIRLLN